MRNLGILIFALALACTPKESKTYETEELEDNPIEQVVEDVTDTEETGIQQSEVLVWTDAEVQQLDVKGYHTQFVNNGGGLLYSKENFEGLWYYDLQSRSSLIITDKAGAGYQPQWIDGKIIYQVKARMKYLESFDFDRKMLQSVNEANRSLTPARYVMEARDHVSAGLTNDLLGIELKNERGEKAIINPQPAGNYISASISPNGELLLYEIAGLGGFVADLSGRTIRELGNVDMPRWVSNSQVVFADSKDDGMQILESKVFVFDLNSENKQALVVDEVALFEPSVSQNGKRISAHSSDGKIYIFNQK